MSFTETAVREFRNTTTAFMGKYKQIEFDFSEVSRIDSAGVEALTESYARSRAAGSNLNITNYADAVDEIHLLVKLLTIFPWSTIGNAYRA